MLEKAKDITFVFYPIPGIYILMFHDEIVYIGQSIDIISRVRQHKDVYKQWKQNGTKLMNGPKNPKKIIRFNRVLLLIEESEHERDEVEWMLISQHKPKYNIVGNRPASHRMHEPTPSQAQVYNKKEYIEPFTGKGEALLRALKLK